jgi:hypothetical protein
VTRDELLATYGRLTLPWRRRRADDPELGRVRARRPHAYDADPQLVHDEYAIAVGEGGRLVMWRFTPLGAEDPVDPGAREIGGRPRYAALPVEETRFDPRDVALAAEQLAAAQQNAAVREAAAIETARTRHAAQEAASELSAETESTGEALRAVTGQEREDE